MIIETEYALQVQTLVEKERHIYNQKGNRSLTIGPLQEPKVIRKYSALELQELGKAFKQAIKEPDEFWGFGTRKKSNGISLTPVKGRKLSNVTSHPSLRERMHDLR